MVAKPNWVCLCQGKRAQRGGGESWRKVERIRVPTNDNSRNQMILHFISSITTESDISPRGSLWLLLGNKYGKEQAADLQRGDPSDARFVTLTEAVSLAITMPSELKNGST